MDALVLVLVLILILVVLGISGISIKNYITNNF